MTLLHSVPTRNELIFRPFVKSTVSALPDALQATYFVTREAEDSADGKIDENQRDLVFSKIRKQDVEKALAHLGGDGASPIVFICGPPPFMLALSGHVRDLGVPKEDIRMETWWIPNANPGTKANTDTE